MSTMDWAKWWQDNWFSITGIGLGALIGWLIAHYYYRKGQQGKLPCYATRSNNFFKNLTGTVPGLVIHFPNWGEPINTLTYTIILVWNAGFQAIRKPDVKAAPITVSVTPCCNILQDSIVRPLQSSNDFSLILNRDRTRVSLGFDHINGNEAVLIRVYHTGASDSDMWLEGKVLDAPPPARFPYHPPLIRYLSAYIRRLVPLTLLVSIVLMQIQGVSMYSEFGRSVRLVAY